ncbi:hypothetical protein [Desulfobotulus mexicanus]|nr:hypothetical protein [Desulfobotulus mexicanus]
MVNTLITALPQRPEALTALESIKNDVNHKVQELVLTTIESEAFFN